MADADMARQGGAVFRQVHQVLQPPLLFGDGQSIPTADTDPGGIVASIFKLCKSIQQDRRSGLLSRESYNTTHIQKLLFRL